MLLWMKSLVLNLNPDRKKEQWPRVPETDCVYVWRSLNPVNDLLYGYGGAKLFPEKVLEAEDWSVDMTTTIGCPSLCPKIQVSNITAFNTDPI